MSINIAVDGPAGAGKSSIARAVAEEIGYISVSYTHLDVYKRQVAG